MTPTVFLHGFMGNTESFQYTLDYIENANRGVYERLYKVNKDKSVETQIIKLQNRDKRPLVMICLEDNMSSLTDQTKYFQTALEQIKKDYNTQHLDVVTHSFGGVVVTNYIMTSKLQGRDINKFITLDSPLQGLNTRYFNKALFIKKFVTKIRFNHPLVREFNKISRAMEFKELNSLLFVDNALKRGKKLPKHLQILCVYFKGSEIVTKESAYGLQDYTSKDSDITCKEVKAKTGNRLITLLGLWGILGVTFFQKELLKNYIKHSAVLRTAETTETIIEFLNREG